ncbi:hypothetical protein [Leptospira santarosai]|uniref:hypothetical protein n=1 Tax=Leptospira santarosai TaxID=28183 RepID=UPI0024AF77AD|nr:hypothetical protein [Leptospira santarosai]MDI7225388.1 hypothetical protein [Leptospira santarosai]
MLRRDGSYRLNEFKTSRNRKTKQIRFRGCVFYFSSIQEIPLSRISKITGPFFSLQSISDTA